MSMSHCRSIIIGLVVFVLITPTVHTQSSLSETNKRSRLSLAATIPAFCTVEHRINRLAVQIDNYGIFSLASVSSGLNLVDCYTGERLRGFGCEFPVGSAVQFLQSGSIWLGGIINRDTVVSVRYSIGHHEWSIETTPDISPVNNPQKRSTLDPDSPEFTGALAEEEYVAVFTDTASPHPFSPDYDYLDKRPHKPLGVKFTMRSMGWSFKYAEDMILFDLTVRNIGRHQLREVVLGLYVIYSVGHPYNVENMSDDITGFLKSFTSRFGCVVIDTVNLMWGADNDGDPDGEKFLRKGTARAATSVVGIRYMGDRPFTHQMSYNWWVQDSPIPPFYDFGPTQRDNYRDFQTGGNGNPEGDRNKYFVMTNAEIDYDQARTMSITQWDPVWQYPDQNVARNTADGDTYVASLLSIGPFDLGPGATIKIPFVIVGGENFHTDPYNIDNLPDNPDAYYANLDFTDLVKNATWAEWIYDNPGYDTDGDGYKGEFKVCVFESTLIDGHYIATRADTIWTRGDGVPDWRAAAPPPPPEFWLTPVVNGLHIRLNGTRSEREVDIWLRQRDFEGYRIYLGRDDREASYSLVASRDNENYDKYVYNFDKNPKPGWDLLDPPFTLDQLQCLYGDSCGDESFDPQTFTRFSPFYHPD